MRETPTAVDQRPTDAPPRWPRLVVVGLLLPLGILGALALSAAATVALADRNHVPIEVQPAAVGMVEIVSIAGTLLAIFGSWKSTRNRGMIAVVGLGFVQLVAGAKAYGWFGLIAPIAAVYLVHLAAEAYQELRAERPAPAAVVPGVPAVPVEAATAPVEPPSDTIEPPAQVSEPVPDTVDQPADPFDQVPIGPVHGPPTLVDDLRARPALPTVRDLIDEVGWIRNRKGEIVPCTRHYAQTTLTTARHGLSVVAS